MSAYGFFLIVGFRRPNNLHQRWYVHYCVVNMKPRRLLLQHKMALTDDQVCVIAYNRSAIGNRKCLVPFMINSCLQFN